MAACPAAQHRGHRGARNLKKPAQINSGDRVIVRVGVFGERLGDEDAGVVDHRSDSADPTERAVDYALSGSELSDIPGDCEHHRIVAWGHIARVGDDRVAEPAVAGDQAGADSLRSAGDDANRLSVHLYSTSSIRELPRVFGLT